MYRKKLININYTKRKLYFDIYGHERDGPCCYTCTNTTVNQKKKIEQHHPFYWMDSDIYGHDQDAIVVNCYTTREI